MTSASEAEPIVLRGGCVVTLSSLRVLWGLEERDSPSTLTATSW